MIWWNKLISNVFCTLKLEKLMTAFGKIFRARNNIEDKFFEAVEAAQKTAQKEFEASETIKRAWRRFKQKKQQKKLERSAIIIQKTWRMHHATTIVNVLRAEKYRQERVDFFNKQATKIQKVWRGYYDRKHVFNFAKQKEYLEQVKQTNEKMAHLLEGYYAETNETIARAEFEKEARKQENIALKQHYLVSTSAIPSVFQPPVFNKDAGALSAVENFIRTVNKAKICVPSVGPR